MPEHRRRGRVLAPIMLLTVTGLLGACGSASGPAPQSQAARPAPQTQTAAPSVLTLEAEDAALALTPQDVVNPGSPSGGEVIKDPNARGRRAVRLSESGSVLTFVVPGYTETVYSQVQVQARGEAFRGNPVVALLRGTQELARVELKNAAYAPQTLGTFALAARDRLSVRLVNGESSKTRAAVIDYLDITEVDSATPPAPPAVPAPAPTPPAPKPPAPTPPAPTPPAPTPPPAPAPGKPSGIKLPPSGKVAWDWQIGAGSDVNVLVPAGVKVIDVDGFDLSAGRVAQLKAQGLYTVCYLDVGSYEPGRPDSDQYPAYLKVQADPDWPGEWFLDVTDIWKPNSVLAKILNNRFKMCADKGFDAIEPDNLQNDENTRGGVITTQQQIDFNGWVADRAHAYGLAVFQKNGPDKILLRDRTGKMMVEKFDGILNESCQVYSECGPLTEYVKRGKLALNAEYQGTLDCALSNRLNINSIKKDQGLKSSGMRGYLRESCN